MENYLFFDHTEIPKDDGSGSTSVDVLIDIDGQRKTFRIGYYVFPIDGDGGEWRVYNDEMQLTDKMLWCYNPFMIN